MEIELEQRLSDARPDVVAVPVTSGGGRTFGTTLLDDGMREAVSRVVETDGVRLEAGAVRLLHLSDDTAGKRLAVVSVGDADRVDADALRTAAASVVREVGPGGGTLAWLLDDELPLEASQQARAVVEGVALGAYDPGRWKSNGRRLEAPERLAFIATSADGATRERARRAATVVRWVNRARDLANRPANDLTPERLAERAFEIADTLDGIHAEALGPEEIEALGMGSFAAVARGSHNPARLIVIRYEPDGRAREDIVLGLVGKAITFDSGGISIKPALYMEDMKGDMAGGAAVVEGMAALADLRLPLRALAVVAATENMVGGGAYRPGDILSAMNGKTIEVINTDAEGRLVLADALWYARQQGATHLLDLATLTGAMELALGDLYAGVFANDDSWRDAVVEAGQASGDLVWPFPLHARYRRYVDSAFADMKNSSVRRQASPALAAEFLQEFVGEGPWAHIDMAGPGFLTWSRDDYLWQKGGTGYGVRLIVELAQRLAGEPPR